MRNVLNKNKKEAKQTVHEKIFTAIMALYAEED